ncbi:hypothetical protein [Devosia sp. SD17-2]|uniref:hypothetical protein n=1 Tax=Devosia sp. SD17-2 TaxID=2976459 RepID=UPI0023D7C187|nr:hypothetical protein [Devosia sp. SD17-2]WEJ34364.1 hypothetical protein NYQ88_06045 [Devosia sp. SD17-2]
MATSTPSACGGISAKLAASAMKLMAIANSIVRSSLWGALFNIVSAFLWHGRRFDDHRPVISGWEL